jgi:hypothetical protein
MLPTSFSFGGLAAASANNIALSQTPTSGTKLTLNGSTVTGGVATLDQARRVLLTFGNEASNRTMVIAGTNAGGMPIQETLAIASGAGSSVFTVQDFLTVTSALPLGGGWTAAVTLGTNAIASSPWKFTNYQEWSPAQISFNLTQSGTATWSIELTNTNLNSNMNQIGGGPLGNYAPVPNVFTANSALSSQTTGTSAAVSDIPFVAWRLKILTGTGSLTCEAIEAGMH